MESKQFQTTVSLEKALENPRDWRHNTKSWQSTGLGRPNELVDLLWLSCYSWADTGRKGEGENTNSVNVPGSWSLPLTEKAVGAAVQAFMLEMLPQGHPQTHCQGSSLEEKILASAPVTLLLTLSVTTANSTSSELEVPSLVWAVHLMLLLTGMGLEKLATSSSNKKKPKKTHQKIIPKHCRFPSAGDISSLGKLKTVLWSGCCWGRVNVWFALVFELGPVFLLSCLCPDVLNLVLHSRCTSLSEYWPHLHSHKNYFVVIRQL